MGQRPERCAVGQTWLSLLAPLRVLLIIVPPFKPLSIIDRVRPTRTTSLALVTGRWLEPMLREPALRVGRAAVRVWLERVTCLL